VLFTRTTDLVQRLQIARRELALEAAIAKLDKYHLLILDDLAYVSRSPRPGHSRWSSRGLPRASRAS
jgi:DNA replication protein DnaC